MVLFVAAVCSTSGDLWSPPSATEASRGAPIACAACPKACDVCLHSRAASSLSVPGVAFHLCKTRRRTDGGASFYTVFGGGGGVRDVFVRVVIKSKCRLCRAESRTGGWGEQQHYRGPTASAPSHRFVLHRKKNVAEYVAVTRGEDPATKFDVVA